MKAATEVETALRNAADSGHAEAQFRLARHLIDARRIDEALPWLRKAMAGGQAEAAVELARVQLYLVETDEAIAEALRLLRWADAKGSPMAPYLLAFVALGDSKPDRDFARINHWLSVSARRRCPLALRALALYFARSPHDEDRRASNDFLRQAVGLGDGIAAQLLAERARLGETMNRDAHLASELKKQLSAAGFGSLPHVPTMAGPGGAEPGAPGRLALERLLELPVGQMLHSAPRVLVCDGVLSAEDCRFVAAMARPHLRRSKVFDPEHGDAIEYTVRTSQDASIDPILEDLWLRLLQLRLAALGDAGLRQAEPLVVLRYGPGEQYRPHYDSLNENAVGQQLESFGQRHRTLCCYLNPVEAGGETEFPRIGVRVEPRPGRAVVFDNLLENGRRDPDSLHAGLPVEAGEKWLATLWLRQQPLRKF